MPWTTDGECVVIYFVYSVNVSSVSNKQAACPPLGKATIFSDHADCAMGLVERSKGGVRATIWDD